MSELTGLHNKLVPRSFEDLRGWIEALKLEGELQEIDVEVDWDCELGTVARKTFGNGDGPALLFNSVKGYGPTTTSGRGRYSRGGSRTTGAWRWRLACPRTLRCGTW